MGMIKMVHNKNNFSFSFNQKHLIELYHMKNTILEIKNLCASITGSQEKILDDLNIAINYGEIHVIMGRNGSGKSTLSNIIVGHPSYQVVSGSIKFKTSEINDLSADSRSLNGIFLCFQNPTEIQGVKNLDFLRKINNEKRKFLGKQILDPLDFFNVIKEKLSIVDLGADFLSRNVNVGFSGGEKKRNEILQLITVETDFCILDEIDSGLDIDSIKSLGLLLRDLKQNDTSILLITHYKKLIDLLQPDAIHVL